MKYFWIGLVSIVLVVGVLFILNTKYDIWNKIISLNTKKVVDVTNMTLDQKMTAFLNNESPYKAEDIQKDLIGRQQMPGDKYGDVTKGLKLGVVGESDIKNGSSLQLEGELFGYREKDNNIILIKGYDGKDGKRFITLERILDYTGADKLKFSTFVYDDGTVDLSSHVEKRDSSKESILTDINKSINKPIVSYVDPDDIAGGLIGDTSGVDKNLLTLFHNGVDNAQSLTNKTARNKLKVSSGVDKASIDGVITIKEGANIDEIIANTDLSRITLVTAIGILK
jgi:hypothetical protein